MELKIIRHNNSLKVSAKPLTLKEVLRLRDGMATPKGPKPSHPYHKQELENNQSILLALN
jgi:hypothetical protein